MERSTKRVRTFLGGEVVGDSVAPWLVWEVPYYPAYYFPIDDVRMELLTETGTSSRSPARGTATHFDVKAGTSEAAGAAWQYRDSPVEQLRDLIRFDWQAMDAWFEEDDEVFVHPRDPYSRVDTLHSSRRVRVEIDGIVVAESTNAVWSYRYPLPESHLLAGRVCFYNEKVDLTIDGVPQARPETHFS